jgi:hypothetical protein
MSQGARRNAFLFNEGFEQQKDQFELQGQLTDFLLQGTTPQAFPGLDLASLGFTQGGIPGVSPLLQQSFDQVSGAGVDNPLAQLRNTGISDLISGEGINFDPALRNSFFQESVDRPVLNNLSRNVLPQIANQFLTTGNTGAAARLGQEAVTEAGRDIAGLRFGALRDEESTRLNLLQQGRTAGVQGANAGIAQDLRGVSALAQLGGLQRAIQGQQNAGSLFQGLLNTPAFDPNLGLLGLLTGSPIAQQQGNAGIAGIGGLLSAAGAATGFLGNV